MSGKSNIQWTASDDGTPGQTWNPVIGCTRVSDGCNFCYAFELHDKRHVAWKRGNWPDAPVQYHKPFSKVQLLEQRLSDPLHWRSPRRVFVNSMADLFHEDVPFNFIDRVWEIMEHTPQHTYQILTKRAERMRSLVKEGLHWGRPPLPNVWLGVSVEDQAAADARIPLLVDTPAAIRFLSCEPLLGPVDLGRWLFDFTPIPAGYVGISEYAPTHALDWVIAGGESGRHARPCNLTWARSLRDQCQRGEVAFFLKQLGTDWARKQVGRHPHGGVIGQWPEDLQVREWPEVRRNAEVRA